jgi:hypothetical protein
MYINDIADGVHSAVKLFADDCLLYRAISTAADCIGLQQDLTHLQLWAQTWQMQFNVAKCKLLRITRNRATILQGYSINNTPLEAVSHHPYLGVELSEDFKWTRHVHKITGKAKSTLGLLRRNLHHCTSQVKQTAYKSLVMPQLEYAGAVWDPHMATDIKACEKVQRQAARFVTNTYRDRTPGCMTRLLSDLGWDTLQSRRQDSRLVLFYKGLNGTAALPLLSTLAVPERSGRSDRRFLPVGGGRSTHRSRTFLPKTVADWNLLPASVTDAGSVPSFKRQLHIFKTQ